MRGDKKMSGTFTESIEDTFNGGKIGLKDVAEKHLGEEAKTLNGYTINEEHNSAEAEAQMEDVPKEEIKLKYDFGSPIKGVRGSFTREEIISQLVDDTMKATKEAFSKMSSGLDVGKKLREEGSRISGRRKAKELENLLKPVQEWLEDNYHPHVTLIVTSTSGELVEGLMTTRRDPDKYSPIGMGRAMQREIAELREKMEHENRPNAFGIRDFSHLITDHFSPYGISPFSTPRPSAKMVESELDAILELMYISRINNEMDESELNKAVQELNEKMTNGIYSAFSNKNSTEDKGVDEPTEGDNLSYDKCVKCSANFFCGSPTNKHRR